MRRVLIMGAGGRDFHDFNVRYRDDPSVEVVAFTAAQIPGIDRRTYPPELAGARYPTGIAIHPEAELEDLVRVHRVDEVVDQVLPQMERYENKGRMSPAQLSGERPPAQAAAPAAVPAATVKR